MHRMLLPIGFIVAMTGLTVGAVATSHTLADTSVVLVVQELGAGVSDIWIWFQGILVPTDAARI